MRSKQKWITRLVTAATCVASLVATSRDLVWNGAPGDAWTLSAPVWLDGATPCAWENGATAVFSGSGLIDVSDEVEAAGLRFTSSGTMLVGTGLIRLSGELDAAAGTENAVAVRLYGAPAMSKTGTGEVSLVYTRGSLAIEEGTVYAGGFNMRDTSVTVSPGATLKSVTPNGRDKSANLLSNASFESPVTGGYYYIGVNGLSPWKRGSANYIVLACASAQKSVWGNALSTVPDGNQIVAVQMNGELTQQVTVPSDGFYDLSFYMFRRGANSQYGPHQLYVSVDGKFFGPMFDYFWSGLPQFVDTGAMYLKAGSHSLTIAGEGFWGDTTTFIDDLVLAPAVLADATSIPSSSGTVVDVATGTQTFGDAYTLVADDHGFCHFTKTGSGKAVFSQNLNVPSRTIFDVEGEAEYSGTLTGGNGLYKRGAGSLTLTTPGGCYFKLQNGDLRIKNYTAAMSVSYLVDQGATAGFYPGLGSGDASLGDMEFQGGGTCLIGTLGDGRTLKVDGVQLNAPRAVFDAGVGDTIRLGNLRAKLVGNRSDFVDNAAVKVGDGTLELTTKPDCYPPNDFTVRAGTLVVDFTDAPWKLSYKPIEGDPVTAYVCGIMRGETTPLALGDGASSMDGSAAFYANCADFSTARPISVHARLANATIGVRQGIARLNGAISFSRSLALDAAAGATLVLGDLNGSAGTAPTVASASPGSVYLNGTVSGSVALASNGGGLSLGYKGVRNVTVASLSLSGKSEFSFGFGGNDRFDVSGALTLGALEVSLLDDSSGDSFDVPGTYTLFTYGSLVGDVSSLSLAASSKKAGYDYSFAATDGAITLTIAAQASNPVYTWAGKTGGTWAGGPWDHASAPSGADKTARFASTIGADATVTLDASETVVLGGLVFSSGSSYTISGGTLQPGAVSALAGRHTIASKLMNVSATPVDLSTAANGTLVLDGEIVGDFHVAAGTVEMGPNACVKGRFTVAAGARLKNANLDASGTLSFSAATGWNADNTATYVAPKTGRYYFVRTGESTASFSVDGEKVLDGAANLVTGWKYLTKGPHLVARSSGDLTVSVRAPDATAATALPDADLRQDCGPDLVSGEGRLIPAAGETFALAQTNSLDAPFAGSLAGAAEGAFVKKNAGEFAARYDGGSLLVREGSLSVLSASDAVAAVRTAADSSINLALPVGLSGLEGAGTVNLGAHAYVRRIEGDADCGISPTKTYTHLCNYSTESFNLPVNGVQFTLSSKIANVENLNNSILDEKGNAGVVPQQGESGFAALMRKLALGNARTNAFIITGLVPGKAYDFRMYLRPYGNSDRRFIHDFIQGGRVIASVTWDPGHSLGNVPSSSVNMLPYSVVGCRYVADETGRLGIRMVKANMKDGNGFHYYAFSNELVDDATVADPTVTSQTASGTRAAFAGTVKGTYGLTVSGEGLQTFGKGAVVATKDFTVAGGETRLQSGAVSLVPAKVKEGARLGLWADSQVAGVTGEGVLDLQLAEENLREGVAADGTFPLAGPLSYPRQAWVTNDLSSGISPHKTYTIAHRWGNTGIAPTVNGVVFSTGNSNDAKDAFHGGAVMATPHGGIYSSTLYNIDPASEVYQLYTQNIAGSYNAAQGAFTITNLTAGVTYEARVYLAAFSTGSRPSCWKSDVPDGDGNYRELHVNQEKTGQSPFYVAVRYTATGVKHVVSWYRDGNPNVPHLQGFTNERVAENVRYLCASNDCSFAGLVTGPGELVKTGPAVQSFTGALDAKALWTVREGTLKVENPASVLTNVCVAGGVFDAVGTVGGDLGVTANGALTVGVSGLSVNGKCVVAAGGGLGYRVKDNAAGTLAVNGDLTLPNDLTLRFDGDKLTSQQTLVTATGTLTADPSGWTVLGSSPKLRNLVFNNTGKSLTVARKGLRLILR